MVLRVPYEDLVQRMEGLLRVMPHAEPKPTILETGGCSANETILGTPLANQLPFIGGPMIAAMHRNHIRQITIIWSLKAARVQTFAQSLNSLFTF